MSESKHRVHIHPGRASCVTSPQWNLADTIPSFSVLTNNLFAAVTSIKSTRTHGPIIRRSHRTIHHRLWCSSVDCRIANIHEWIIGPVGQWTGPVCQLGRCESCAFDSHRAHLLLCNSCGVRFCSFPVTVTMCPTGLSECQDFSARKSLIQLRL
jgi:hypothetical protein